MSDAVFSRGTSPRVSLGLPVYNGGEFLIEAIESVLGQTFADFELIIADNDSTDETADTCRRYQAKDKRIRFHQNATNLGASRNFNYVFELSRAKLFRWVAADDLLEPTCIERCVQVLDTDPSVILAHTDVKIIDEDRRVKVDFRYPAGHASSESAAQRFLDVVRLDRWCAELFGLVRSDVMRRTRLMDRYVASDRILRAELALRGRYEIVPEPLFLNRDHPGRSVRALPAHHLRGEWFDPSRANKRILPHWRIMLEYLRCIRQAPISADERRRCYVHTIRWLGIHMNWARLGADVLIAAVPGSWKPLMRVSQTVENRFQGE
jgi:glycosyltransferase involved in cell wall biosynthesis